MLHFLQRHGFLLKIVVKRRGAPDAMAAAVQGPSLPEPLPAAPRRDSDTIMT
jgi:hypothetical protein